ncbi:MAG: hypothetical protein SPF89_07185 [Sphaerochaetaceae bacterium]|nr:hypothetical protein [Spirochaetales bacterium]MDY5499870.1 hypothetical protein [Sphaerochaetaceae bacterium]
MKKHLLVATLFFAAMALSAQEPFSVSSGDLALYNENGERLALDENAARTATNGWVIQTQDRPVTIQTPVGTIGLSSNATLVTGDLSETRPSLYLVDGEASFSTAQNFTGRLTVSTPVSRYRATGYSSMKIITTDGEESISMYVGNAQSVNGLTHKATQVKAMEKLDQKTGQITLLDAEDKEPITRIPDAPTFSGVVVTPYHGSIPSQPQNLTVLRLPAVPGGMSVQVIEVAPVPSQISVGSEPVKDDAFLPAPTPSQLEEDLAASRPAEKARQPKKPSDTQLGVVVSYEYDRAGKHFYTNEDDRISKNLHQFDVKPYFESKYFGLKLDLSTQTLNYDDWDNDWSSNLTHFDSDGWKETTGSVMSYIDSFHLGSKSGHLWMAVDKEPLNEEGKIMTGYHAVQPDWKNLSLGMRFGSVRINGTFDDVELHHMREEDRSLYGWQSGNLSLSLVDDDLSFFSFGAVYALHGDKAAAFSTDSQRYSAVSYPYVEVNIPVLGNKRQYHFNLLGSAATYLPVSPDMDFDYIYDSDESSFDNFLLLGGLSFGTKAWDLQLTAGHHKGFINPYARTPFVRSVGQNYLQYKSDMDARLQATCKGRYFSFGASYTLPFDFEEDDKIARFSSGVDTDLHADMLAIGLSAQLKGFTLSAGYEVYGLNDMHGLDDANDLSTMLKASLAYDWSFLHLEGGVKRDIDSSTSPLIGYALCELDFHKGF